MNYSIAKPFDENKMHVLRCREGHGCRSIMFRWDNAYYTFFHDYNMVPNISFINKYEEKEALIEKTTPGKLIYSSTLPENCTEEGIYLAFNISRLKEEKLGILQD